MKSNGELEFEYEYWQQITILIGQIARRADKMSQSLVNLIEQNRDALVVATVGECHTELMEVADSCEAIMEVVQGRITYHKERGENQQ